MTGTGNQETTVCYDRNQKPVLCVMTETGKHSVGYDKNWKPVQCVMTETEKTVLCVVTETGNQFCVL